MSESALSGSASSGSTLSGRALSGSTLIGSALNGSTLSRNALSGSGLGERTLGKSALVESTVFCVARQSLYKRHHSTKTKLLIHHWLTRVNPIHKQHKTKIIKKLFRSWQPGSSCKQSIPVTYLNQWDRPRIKL